MVANITSGGNPYHPPAEVAPIKITPHLHDTWASAASGLDPSRVSVTPDSCSKPQIPAPDLPTNAGYDAMKCDSEFLRDVKLVHMQQIDINTARALAANREVKTGQDTLRHLQESIWKLRDEVAQVVKKDQVLKKVDLGLSILLVISFVAMLVLSVATIGGLGALQTVLHGVQGISALGQGAAGVTKIVFDKKKNKLESEIVGEQALSHKTGLMSGAILKESKRDIEAQTTVTTGLRHVLENSVGG